jgi:hypothetical protein
MSSLTPSKTVGSTKKPLPVALAPGQELGPLLLADVHVAEDLVHLLLRDLRALLGIGIEGIAQLAALCLVSETPDEFAVDLIFDKQAATGGTALAAVEVDGVERPGDRLLQVAVGENHVRALPAEFAGDALESVGRGLLNDLGRLVVAGEGDLVHVGMGDEGRPGGLAVAVEHVEDAVGEPGLQRQLSKAHSGQRRLLG